jgi:hypothetical protein
MSEMEKDINNIEPKKQNRFFAFFITIWTQTRFCVKSFLFAVLVLALVAVMRYVTLYLYISSGGLNVFASNTVVEFDLGYSFLAPCLFFWALICLIVSVVNIRKPTNIVLSILGSILVLAMTYLDYVPIVRGYFGQSDRAIMRYYAHTSVTIEILKEFSENLNILRTDENFTFTEQFIKDLSEKKSHWGTDYVYYFLNFDFNKNLLGLKLSEIPHDVVVLFQSGNDESRFSDSNNISAKWHYDRGSLIVFGDGRLVFVKKENFDNLRWKP